MRASLAWSVFSAEVFVRSEDHTFFHKSTWAPAVGKALGLAPWEPDHNQTSS